MQIVWSGIQVKKVGLEPLSSLWWVLTSIKRGFCLLSIALLLLTPRAKIHQNVLRGFLLLDGLMRYVDGQVWDTLLHEQAKAGAVGEFLEPGG